MSHKTASLILIFILCLAGFLRLYGLNRGDAISDEVLLSFRAIKMVDFDEGDFQTTPLEWFDKSPGGIPWWTGLSFHDHPPLVFFTQHVFMQIFGENSVAFRLPSVLFGLGSVYLVYLLGTLLFSVEAGLISALLLAVTVNHVYVSRIGLQESYVIFFVLLSLYYFFKADKKSKNFIYSGIAVGFGLLAKYTVGIVFPIIVTYTLLFKREYLRKPKFWIGGLLSLIIFLPVIVYNIEMYRAVGHFDFQISAMMGDRPAVWPVQPGKEIGTIGDRIRIYMPNLYYTNSPVLLFLFVCSLLWMLILLLKKKLFEKYDDRMRFFLVSFDCIVLLMLAIGPQFRFLTLLTPFIGLSVGLFIYTFSQYVFEGSTPKVLKILVSIIFMGVLVFELFYSWNSEIAFYPKGEMNTAWSKLRFENYNWGYNELGTFLDKELAGKAPAMTFDTKYDFLGKIKDEAVTKAIDSGAELYPAFFVYGGNFDKAGKLWTIDRLHIFHGWPVISMSDYLGMLKENGEDFFQKSGFTKSYFIFANNKIPDDNDRVLIKGANKTIIKNPRGDEVFYVYSKDL